MLNDERLQLSPEARGLVWDTSMEANVMIQELKDDNDPEQQARLVIHRSDLQFRRLLEKLPAAAYTCDTEGLITYYNQAALDLWGRAPKLNNAQDRYCGSFKLFNSDDGTPISHESCWMALALTEETDYYGQEIVIERPQGNRLTVMAYANPIYDEWSRLVGAVNVLVDITERKQAEERLNNADRAKNEFLATLAHELRNPLAPIRNAVEILHLNGNPSLELQWALDVIDRQMNYMTRLIDDLLDLARITEKKLRLRKESVALTEIIRTAIEASRPLIDSRSQEFDVALPSDPVVIHGDPTRLAQVIANLLNNASRYTEVGGKIWLSTQRQGDHVVVTVRDTGIGIVPEMLPRIFDMFVQTPESMEHSRGGLGIGLTLAKQLIEGHGGSIVAHSNGLGTGSEFAVYLQASTPSSQSQQSVRPEKTRSYRRIPLRILVVDDNQDSATSLGVLLRMVCDDVRAVNDGIEALRVTEEFKPNVVLLDIGLPGMNGFDVARAIRGRKEWEKVVLVALTGWGAQEDREESYRAGFKHHLVKPVNPPVLLALLESIAEEQA